MTNPVPKILDDLTLVSPPEWWQRPWVWIVAVAGAVVVGFLIRAWMRRVPEPVAMEPVPDGPGAAAVALQELSELRKRQPDLGAYRVGIEVSEILRTYLGAAHGIPVLFQTTREFLGGIAGNPAVSKEQRGTLGTFLGFCDDVKFARGEATIGEQVRLIDTAESVVRSGMGREGPR